MNKVALSLSHVNKVFKTDGQKTVSVIHDVSLDILSGEIFVFVGPSGSGKSTLLRIMSGIEKSFTGEVKRSKDVSPHDMSFVFQQFAIMPWLTVFENVELALIARGVKQGERGHTVMRELKQLGLEKSKDSYPRDLSGGMRQRVGIARALVTNPKIIFMDEPFSELDSFTAASLRKELLDIWQERRPTIVMVTHVVEEALELADKIAVLTPRPARVEKVVVDNLPRPRDTRSKNFYQLEDELYQLIKP
ncbi:MAG: ABC transporter ATP-binding protein [Candidatus Wildermuthbacteria bacterium]|nr:ABC transporter ATP-binding protein [Candidatus Wildermuthbacteria bacterium]